MRRHSTPTLPEIFETDGDGTFRPTEYRVKIHAQTRNGGSINKICRAARKGSQSLFRAREIACQELAFGAVQLELEA